MIRTGPTLEQTMASLRATPRAGAYRVGYADPPWRFQSYAPPKPEAKGRRDAERHYPTMPIKDILALGAVVQDVMDKDSVFYLWTSGPFLEQSMAVLRAFGYRYATRAFTWAKLNPNAPPEGPWGPADFAGGTGYYGQANTEMVLVGRRGKGVPRAATGALELHISPVREHSRKPETIREDIDLLSGPDVAKLEMFSRTSGEGWDAWGLDVGLFDGE